MCLAFGRVKRAGKASREGYLGGGAAMIARVPWGDTDSGDGGGTYI